jgi:beta-aspartyl-peptidase (threonine type)
MKALVLLLLALAALLPIALARREAESEKIVLVIHGGAGILSRKQMTPRLEKQFREALEQSLAAGRKALERKSGTSLDAVVEAIKVMEDSPLFNAGKGAVFTHDGRNELDASVMEGKERRAGAVAGVTCVKNPIAAARAVMEKSPHVMLAGRGADLYATKQGLEIVDPSYYWTKERWLQLKEALDEEEKARKGKATRRGERGGQRYLGTVGAVARDRHGNLAAGTSTGGMTNKRFGRIGDSPVIGAGTYADNSSCAVSCTGHGEVFIRYTVAHDVAARMRYAKRSVAEAAREVLAGLPREPGGVGGLIALDAEGNAAMRFDTEGMYRGTVTSGGKVRVTIYDR